MNGKASAHYQRVSSKNACPRESEIAAFSLVNRLLTAEGDSFSRIKALGKNHDLWSLLVKDLALVGNSLPAELKAQLTELGFWAMKYSIRAMSERLSLEPLIEVNRNISDGLREQAAATDTSGRRAEGPVVV